VTDLSVHREVLAELFGPAADRPFAVRFWDGTVDAPEAGHAAFTLTLRTPGALRRMLLPPTELSVVDAYLYGHVDIEGDMEAAANLGDLVGARLASWRVAARLARRVLTLRPDRRDTSTALEHRWRARLRRSHSRRRDRQAVRFHYDLGNDFFALWLDRRMVYSCAYFEHENVDLDAAQEAKLDHVCRKLRLHVGERLLDIGCGWGALIIHAAKHYGAEALGVTLSEHQATLAQQRIVEAGLADRCRVELRDYRELAGEGVFDKITSIGMVEHVGLQRLPNYFRAAYRALKPGGLFLNHGIVTIAGARVRSLGHRLASRVWRRNVFINRYVFPDGILEPAALMIGSAEGVGFETRDVESLREHYVMTLRHWVSRIERQEREVIRLVGEFTYRVWRLYLAGSAHGFASGRIGVLQTLLAKPDERGATGLPLTRADLYEQTGLALSAPVD
jgi:cyclopropane-fatty-acyl-phospholipid synthase